MTVYGAGLSGTVNATPIATIFGSNTGLADPSGIALDSSLNIYVINNGGSVIGSGGTTVSASVTEYAAASSGNVAPIATITGQFDPTGIALDSADNIYVVDAGCGPCVNVYAAGSSGAATPIAVISNASSGSTTALDNPNAVAVDSAANIYVANDGAQIGDSDTVTVYPAGSGTGVVPSATIVGSNTGLNFANFVAFDSSKNIYVTNLGSNSVTVYPAGSNGNTTPSTTISGANTGLDLPEGVALDGSNNIYVANFNNNSVTVYPAGSTGNATPSATIVGASTGLNGPIGVALDSTGKIYVASDLNNSVNVYPAGSSGNATPSATISGANTGLSQPTGVALDSADNIYVANFNNNTVTVYPAGLSGTVNQTPTATIVGDSTGLVNPVGVRLDGSNNIYVANSNINSVTVYPAGSTGNATPSATISGSSAELSEPRGIALDSNNNIYVGNDFNPGSVTVYPAGSNSNNNATPSAIINGDFALTSNGMSLPVGIVADNAHNGSIYVTNQLVQFKGTGSGSAAQTVQVYSGGNGTTGGTNLGHITESGGANGIALDSLANIYIITNDGSEVDIFSAFNDGFGLVPIGALHGDRTLISNAGGIALDANDNLYLTNDASDILGDRVTVYPADSTGNQPPTAVIVGSNTELAFPAGLTLDSSGNIYVANKGTDAVTVYPSGLTGTVNVAPSSTISGSNTLLNTPSDVALDSNNRIYVTNAGGFEGGNVSVTVYAAGATGNATPVTTISGPNTQLARPGGIAILPPL